MRTNTIESDRSRFEVQTTPRGRSSPNAAEALDDTTIANLSAITISQVTRDELVRVIRAARLPLVCGATDGQLEFHDRSTLERLVYLARHCCRNRATDLQSRRSVVQRRD